MGAHTHPAPATGATGAMKLRYAAKTDIGMKRVHNEDYFAVLPDHSVFIVADGMGGHASGEVASKLAADTIGEFYERTAADEDATWPYKLDHSLSFDENRLACAVRLANLRIHEAASANYGRRGMGTTIVTAAALNEHLCVAHVGDSRAYRVRGDAITQLTRDHSLLEDYKEATPSMTLEEEQQFPHKNVITRALGLRDRVEVDIRTHALEPGDLYLLCTDGLSGMITDEEILRIIREPPSLEHVVAQLVELANVNGGTDNVTIVLLEFVGVVAADGSNQSR